MNVITASRIIVSVGVAIPAASLCINRRLYHIASVKSVKISKAEKSRGVIVDLAIGLGFPLFFQLFCSFYFLLTCRLF